MSNPHAQYLTHRRQMQDLHERHLHVGASIAGLFGAHLLEKQQVLAP